MEAWTVVVRLIFTRLVNASNVSKILPKVNKQLTATTTDSSVWMIGCTYPDSGEYRYKNMGECNEDDCDWWYKLHVFFPLSVFYFLWVILAHWFFGECAKRNSREHINDKSHKWLRDENVHDLHFSFAFRSYVPCVPKIRKWIYLTNSERKTFKRWPPCTS